MSHFDIMRRNMVQGQLLPEGVTNPRILSAFAAIPREKFVPHQRVRVAYMDAAFPLQKGCALMRPATLGRLLEACEFEETHNILYVGCGTGYGPALLGHMGLQVTAIDDESALTQQAERLLQDLSFASIEVILAPLSEGWKAKGPYDRIIIEGAIESLPPCFEAQLKKKGEIVGIDASCALCQRAVRYRKGKPLTKESLFHADGPRLPGFKTKEFFVFSGKETDFVYGKS